MQILQATFKRHVFGIGKKLLQLLQMIGRLKVRNWLFPQ
jgi:hypothetical protein